MSKTMVFVCAHLVAAMLLHPDAAFAQGRCGLISGYGFVGGPSIQQSTPLVSTLTILNESIAVVNGNAVPGAPCDYRVIPYEGWVSLQNGSGTVPPDDRTRGIGFTLVPSPNPRCEPRFLRVDMLTRVSPVGTTFVTRWSIFGAAMQQGRPRQQQPDGSFLCVPNLKVDPAGPGKFLIRTKGDGMGTRG